MDNVGKRTGGWARRVLWALAVAAVAAGCGPAGEKEVRKGRAAEALGNYAEAKQCYAQAVAVDNADGARLLAELLVSQDAAELFGASAEKDAQWLAKAESLDAQIARLVRQAEANGASVEGVKEALDAHEKAIREAQEALERAEAERRAAEEKAAEERRQAAEAARLKAEAEARVAAEEARRKAEEEAKKRAAEKAAADATRSLFLKAKKAEEDGLINFYGFYLGMPEEDALALREHYGLTKEDCTLWIVEHGAEVSQVRISLSGLRHLTKGGNSFDELAQAVANRVGDLKWKTDVDHLGRHNWYEYKTIDGVLLTVSERNGLTMQGGKLIETLAAQHKEEWSKKAVAAIESTLGTGKEAGESKTIALGGGVEMEMVWCPRGSFLMGSSHREEKRCDDETQHEVTLTKGFWMAKTEVTQAQWKSVMGNNPSKHKGDDLPVEVVSWEDAQVFCLKAGLQLPTEAEWEYACRAGSTGPYAGSGVLDEMGWHPENSGGKTHPVGQKKPNAWGLYDMHGNVDEWCADWYDSRYYAKSPLMDPKGPVSGSERVHRGGSWGKSYWWKSCRSACRDKDSPRDSDSFCGRIGFRPVFRQDVAGE